MSARCTLVWSNKHNVKYRGSAANDNQIFLGSLAIDVAPDIATADSERTACRTVSRAPTRGPVGFLKHDTFSNVFNPNLKAAITG